MTDYRPLIREIERFLMAAGHGKLSAPAAQVAVTAAVCYLEDREYKLCARHHGCSYCDPACDDMDGAPEDER